MTSQGSPLKARNPGKAKPTSSRDAARKQQQGIKPLAENLSAAIAVPVPAPALVPPPAPAPDPAPASTHAPAAAPTTAATKKASPVFNWCVSPLPRIITMMRCRTLERSSERRKNEKKKRTISDALALALSSLFLSSRIFALLSFSSCLPLLFSSLQQLFPNNRSRKLPPLAEVKANFSGGFSFMATSLEFLGDATGVGRRDPSSVAVGRAILGAIRACAQSSFGAHLASSALERALAESELRHKQGMKFLFVNLVIPVIDTVGGPVAAAVIKCCLPAVGPQSLSEQGGGADPASAALAAAAAAAAAAQNKHLAGLAKLDERDMAAAPELVSAAVLGRLTRLIKGMNADMGSLPTLEQRYQSAYQLAQDASSEVIKAAKELCERAAADDKTSPEAAAAAAAAAAARGRNDAEDGFPPELLDKCNDEYNRFFQEVDGELQLKLARALGNVAGAATARVHKAYVALSASMERHQAKELRDSMMLRSLRRIADGGEGGSGGSGGSGSSVAAALAAVLEGYDRAVKEQQERLAAI